MEPQQLSTLLLGVIIALPSLGAYLATSARKDRKQKKKMTALVDQWEEWAIESRSERRRHNDHYHADGEGAIEIKPLPQGWMEGDDDD